MFRATGKSFISLVFALIVWAGVAVFPSIERQVGNTSPIPTGTATLVVFNDSGLSPVPFKLSIREQDRTVVSLSRHEYQRVSIRPGRHVYNVMSRNSPRAVLDAEAGQTFYLVAAYKPERSYVPFAEPFVLKAISADEAGTLAARMTEKIAVMPENDDGEDEPAVTTMHAPRAPNQSPGVSLTLQEWSRAPGRKGTAVMYRIRTAGFPPGKTFHLQHADVAGQWKRTTVLTGLRSDASGVLTGGRVPIEELRITISDYYRGEAMLIEVLADDGSIYAVDKIYPFPLAATDGTCVVWAELANEQHKEFRFFGDGFEPGEQIRLTSTDGRDPREWTQPANESGGFAVPISHESSGGAAVFSAAGEYCKPVLRYEFGTKADRQ